MRECFTSYKVSKLLPNERHDTPPDALCFDMQPLDGPLAVISLLTLPLVSWPSTTTHYFTKKGLSSKSAESRIETRTLLQKELSKNLNLNSFN